MKKIILFLTILGILYLSNVPNLIVSEPITWINKPIFEENLSITNLLHWENIFYSPWSEHRTMEFYLHKAGHIVAYAMLTIFFYLNLTTQKRGRITLLFVVMFALTDEIHQYFIVGRSGRLMDAGFDSFVSLTVLSIIWAFARWNSRKTEYVLNLKAKTTSV